MSRVSVIMPIYNVERYVHCAIDSVLNQTYTSFELILVDDGSTDRSGDIADKYAGADGRVKVVHKENGGLSDARNAGLLLATGEYIIFIDSDDHWDKTLLEESLGYAEINKLDVVIFGCSSDFFNTAGQLVNSCLYSEAEKIIDDESVGVKIAHQNLLGYAWNKLYKASAIRGSGDIRFQKGTSYIEDLLFNESVFKVAKRVGFLNQALYHYAQRQEETLGVKYYDNIDKLDIMANEALYSILQSLKVSQRDIDTSVEQNAYARARWTIGVIANTDSIGRSEKLSKIQSVVSGIKITDNVQQASSGLTGSIYRHLFAARLVGPILLIENIRRCKLGMYLKDLIPNTLKGEIVYWVSRSDPYRTLDKNSKKVVVALAADYGNLGDVAITYAQKKFLENNLKGYYVVELPISRTYQDLRSLKKKVLSSDIITIVGGGNIGDMYQDIEDLRKFVVSKFPDNRIISFPQTIDFSDTKKGRQSLSDSKRVYDRHQYLTMLLREQKSLDFAAGHFTCRSFLTPDVVLSLDESNNSVKRQKDSIVFCIRKDEESKLSPQQRERIESFFMGMGKNISYRDTHIGNVRLSSSEAKRELDEIWDVFRRAELVVTDRLHGMIFCAITNTPCIAINNSNGKVAGVYDKWVTANSCIELMDGYNISDINRKTKEILRKEKNPAWTPVVGQLEKIVRDQAGV